MASTPQINGYRFQDPAEITWTVDAPFPAPAGWAAEALSRWSAVCGLTFRQVDASDPDPEIIFTSTQAISPGSTGIAGIAQLFPSGGTYIDFSAIGLSDSAAAAGQAYAVDILVHELGHGLADLVDNPGGEAGGRGSIMNYVNSAVGYPGPDDIEAVQALYGRSDKSDLVRLGDGNASGFYAGGGNDTVYGEDGADVLYGNLGSDALYGNIGNDTIFGGQNEGPAGADGVFRQGSDRLFGGQGADVIYGNHGSDILYGNFESDTMFGGQDADTMYGGQGDDVLNGNLGDDVFYGGLGADTHNPGAGNDVAVGFSGGGGDRIDLADPASALLGDVGGSLVITHSQGTITLIGLNSAGFDTGWLF